MENIDLSDDFQDDLLDFTFGTKQNEKLITISFNTFFRINDLKISLKGSHYLGSFVVNILVDSVEKVLVYLVNFYKKNEHLDEMPRLGRPKKVEEKIARPRGRPPKNKKQVENDVVESQPELDQLEVKNDLKRERDFDVCAN